MIRYDRFDVKEKTVARPMQKLGGGGHVDVEGLNRGKNGGEYEEEPLGSCNITPHTTDIVAGAPGKRWLGSRYWKKNQSAHEVRLGRTVKNQNWEIGSVQNRLGGKRQAKTQCAIRGKNSGPYRRGPGGGCRDLQIALMRGGQHKCGGDREYGNTGKKN